MDGARKKGEGERGKTGKESRLKGRPKEATAVEQTKDDRKAREA